MTQYWQLLLMPFGERSRCLSCRPQLDYWKRYSTSHFLHHPNKIRHNLFFVLKSKVKVDGALVLLIDIVQIYVFGYGCLICFRIATIIVYVRRPWWWWHSIAWNNQIRLEKFRSLAQRGGKTKLIKFKTISGTFYMSWTNQTSLIAHR